LDFGTVKAFLLNSHSHIILGILANALLAPVEDVFFGIYALVSVNREGDTNTPDDAAFYAKLYNILNSSLAKSYWVQTNGSVSFPTFIYRNILIILHLQLARWGRHVEK
jgi:hypothetical protein